MSITDKIAELMEADESFADWGNVEPLDTQEERDRRGKADKKLIKIDQVVVSPTGVSVGGNHYTADKMLFELPNGEIVYLDSVLKLNSQDFNRSIK
jgi:hypothetical protein